MSTNPQETPPPQDEENKASDKEFNFAQLRKKQEQTEYELVREREERGRLVADFEALKAQRQQDKQPEDEDEDSDNDEPYIDKKALKRHLKKMEKQNKEDIKTTAEQIAKKAIAEERRRNDAFRLKTLYPDFNEVLSEASAQRLTERFPDLADKILKVQDEDLRKEMAYQTIKSLNLHKPDAPKQDLNAQIAQKQRSPYYYPSSVATPPSGSTDFSEVGQKQAYEKMKSLIKNRRS